MNANTDDRIPLRRSKECLTVTYLPLKKTSGSIEPAAWRVAVAVDSRELETACKYRAFSLEFGRLEDATRALDALQSWGLTTSERLRDAGKGLVHRIMLESLAW